MIHHHAEQHVFQASQDNEARNELKNTVRIEKKKNYEVKT